MTSLSEAAARYQQVAPLRLDPARGMAESAELPQCVQLRGMPDPGAERIDGGCVTGGILTGRSATDTTGGDWLHLVANDVSGWAPERLVGVRDVG